MPHTYREPLDLIRSTTGLSAASAAVSTAAPAAAPSIGQEGNYATLSEASDEMYAAIDEEDNVYMDPEGGGGRSSAASRDEAGDDPSLMYSKVDKNRKRTLRRGAEGGGSGYAMVNKPQGNALRRSAATDSYGASVGTRQQAASGGPWRSEAASNNGGGGGYHYAAVAGGRRGGGGGSPRASEGAAANGARPRQQQSR